MQATRLQQAQCQATALTSDVPKDDGRRPSHGQRATSRLDPVTQSCAPFGRSSGGPKVGPLRPPLLEGWRPNWGRKGALQPIAVVTGLRRVPFYVILRADGHARWQRCQTVRLSMTV